MIRNLVQEHVLDAFNALKGHFPDFCGCDICRADVLVYALNRLPARYVASREGTVISELSLDRSQNRTDIDVVLLDAFRRIHLAPRCGREKQP